MSILYAILHLLCLLLVSSLVIITDLMVLKLNDLTVTDSLFLPFSVHMFDHSLLVSWPAAFCVLVYLMFLSDCLLP